MKVTYVGKTLSKSDYFPHTHQNNSEILYITNGTGRVSVQGEVFEVSTGDIIFCPKHLTHTGPGGDCGLIYIVADITIPENLCQHFIIKDDGRQTIGNLFNTIYDVFKRPDSGISYEKIESSLCELIFDLAFSIKRRSQQDSEVNALCNVIECGFSDSNFNLGNEMKNISCSVTYLRRKFNQNMGISPIKYLNQIRINHAKKLIAKRVENRMPISEIAFLCGFNDERYFSRLFKQHCNMTPIEYFKQTT